MKTDRWRAKDLSRNLDFESGIGHLLPLAAAPALSYGICPVVQELRYTVPLHIAIKPRAPGTLQPRVRQDDCRKSLDSSGNRILDIFLLLNDADVLTILSQDVVNAFPARTIRPRTVDKDNIPNAVLLTLRYSAPRSQFTEPRGRFGHLHYP
jgi:hypothetical protein